MPERGSPSETEIWRIPPWQPAALILLACAVAALNIYGHPSAAVRIATLFVGLVCLFLAYCAIHFVLLADGRGIWVRRLLHPDLVRWEDLHEIEVIPGARGAATIRLTRADHTYVDVPPSLLLPSRPSSVARAQAIVHSVATRLRELAAAHPQ